MTRIDIIPVEEMHNKHVVSGVHEITRVYGHARKAQFDILKGKRKLPETYRMNTGHEMFFYDKLGFISKRYQELTTEMIRRGFKPNPIPIEELEKGIDRRLFKDYNPTPEALEINRQRIAERLAVMKS